MICKGKESALLTDRWGTQREVVPACVPTNMDMVHALFSQICSRVFKKVICLLTPNKRQLLEKNLKKNDQKIFDIFLKRKLLQIDTSRSFYRSWRKLSSLLYGREKRNLNGDSRGSRWSCLMFDK